jgi:hypothetical protein
MRRIRYSRKSGLRVSIGSPISVSRAAASASLRAAAIAAPMPRSQSPAWESASAEAE